MQRSPLPFSSTLRLSGALHIVVRIILLGCTVIVLWSRSSILPDTMSIDLTPSIPRYELSAQISGAVLVRLALSASLREEAIFLLPPAPDTGWVMGIINRSKVTTDFATPTRDLEYADEVSRGYIPVDKTSGLAWTKKQREVAVTDTGLICALVARRRVLNALVRRTDCSHDKKQSAPVVTLTFRLDIKLGF